MNTITNLFMLAPNGVVVSCVINGTGTSYEHFIAGQGRLSRKLSTAYDSSCENIVVDSEIFKLQKTIYDKVKKDELGLQFPSERFY